MYRLRSSAPTLLIGASLVASAAAGIPSEVAATPTPTIRQFLQIRTPGPPVVLPDGSLLLRDWPDGVNQLYRVYPGEAQGTARSYRPGATKAIRLTSFPDGLSSFSVSHDGRRVILMHGRGGDENTQLTLLDLGGSAPAEPRPVLSNPRVQARINLWLRDGSGFLYSANADSPNDFHIYRHDFASGEHQALLAREGAWVAQDVTLDGSRVLVERRISASDSRCYELVVATGEMRDITVAPAGGTASCTIVGYLPGERVVLLRSDLKEGRHRLYLKDLGSGAVWEPIPGLGKHELDGAGINDTREYLVLITNEDGYGKMSLYTLPDFRPAAAPPAERGVVTAATMRGRTLVWTLNNARSPGMSFATQYPAPGSKAQPTTVQLTWTEDQGIDLSRFPLPELVRYPAFDGRQIPAFVFLPPDDAKGSPIPFVILYHGGPESQHRPTFNATMQYLLARGFGVMMPNVRGSTGYGREFQMLDDYKKRWDSVRDGVDAAEWLVKQGYGSPGRIATYGSSYGGFMAVACVVEDQERVERGERRERLFGACVDIVGLVNLETFLEKTSGYRRKLREVEYGPLSDREFLASVSSIHRADKIQVPVFIAHGFNDPRVPVEEAMRLAAALRERGRSPRLFVAPDEGHGFAKLDNRIYFGERVAQFLDETIGAGTGSPRPQVSAQPDAGGP